MPLLFCLPSYRPAPTGARSESFDLRRSSTRTQPRFGSADHCASFLSVIFLCDEVSLEFLFSPALPALESVTTPTFSTKNSAINLIGFLMIISMPCQAYKAIPMPVQNACYFSELENSRKKFRVKRFAAKEKLPVLFRCRKHLSVPCDGRRMGVELTRALTSAETRGS